MLRGPNIAGAVSEALVTAYLASRGYEVFAPMQPHTRADFIYVTEDRTVKIQVKTATRHSTAKAVYEQCRLVRNDNSTGYQASEVDELWAVGTHLWRFPISMLEGRSGLLLFNTHQAPRKTVRDYNPNDFIVVAGSFERPFRERAFAFDDEPATMINNTDYAPSVNYAYRDGELVGRVREGTGRSKHRLVSDPADV